MLQHLRRTFPTVCLSSADFLVELSKVQPNPGDVTRAADVSQLYPSINHNYGIPATKCILDKLATNNLLKAEDVPFIIDLLTWILNNSYVQFEQNIYKQRKGTAMGISIAVCYADFVLLFLEADAVACPGVRFYKRYIDDIFAITSADCQIIEIFNSKCPDIQLDAITSGPSAVFLDLTITINDDLTISTTLFEKKFNRHLYLTPSSAHKEHVSRNLIKTELERYRTHCSHDSDFEACWKRLYQRLIARGYQHVFLAPHFIKLPERAPLMETLLQHYLRKQQPQQQQQRRQHQQPNVGNNKGSPLVLITMPPTPRMRINWKSLLIFTPELLNSPKFMRIVGNLPIIIARRHRHAAKYYLTRHRNLLLPTNIKEK